MIEKITGLRGITRNVAAVVVPELGSLDYASGSDVTGRLKLSYDAAGAGLNMPLTSIDSFLVNFAGGDYRVPSPIPITITLTSNNEVVGSLTRSMSQEGLLTLELKVSQFTNVAVLDLGTSSMRSVDVLFAPAATSADFTLTSIAIVPEPSTRAMALAGLACGGSSVVRRRKRA